MTDLITDVRYPVLDAIDKAMGSIEYVALLNNLKKSSNMSPRQASELLNGMRDADLISGVFTSYGYVYLESDGTQLLLQLRADAEKNRKDAEQAAAKEIEDAAQRAVDTKKQWRHEWRVALVSAAFGSVVTLCIEHFDVILVRTTQLLGWLASFFH